MKYNFIPLILCLLLISSFAEAQKMKKEDRLALENIQKHIRFLADDKLEGRRTGTAGEATAAAYIADQFKQIGLQPKGSNAYLQSFEVNDGKLINPSTSLVINNQKLETGKDFFPLPFSPNTVIEASPSMALKEPGMPWFFDLKDLLEENATNPHFDLSAEIINSAKQVQKRGGTAVFIYNSSDKEDKMVFDEKDKSETIGIPVVWLSKQMAARFLSDEAATIDIKLKTDIGEKKRVGKNVIGYLDNGASTTIIIGAHFDHLGYGEDGGSREVSKKMLLHNGADDNASGTAALMELARMIREEKLKNSNFLFIAFSGEELGLYGSKFFTQHPTIDLASVNCMINMDMVGRLNDSSHVLTVGGYGTTAFWGEAYHAKGKKALYSDDLSFRFDSSGTGPSDHTSFYLKNIPVLFFFTGLHADYHKATDDFEKINYNGELKVVKHILSLVETVAKKNSRLLFLKTRETQTTTTARFSVTLGIMPDYTFNGAGVRADAVSDNKPAQKAGLKAGDVIVSIGDYKISSLETYMQTLGKFKKGDKTTLVYQREGKPFSTTVEF